MIYRVKFYDPDQHLLCWFTTRNKAEAMRYAQHKMKHVKAEVSCEII